MENLGKALSYGVSAFLFVLAASIALVSYNNIIKFVDSILTTSEIHDHSAEGIQTSFNVETHDNILI